MIDDVEQVTDPLAFHAEGPVWHPSWGGLRWVDMLAGDILTLHEETGRVERTHVGRVAAALRPRERGGMVVAIEQGFILINEDGTATSLGELWTDPSVRMNEGGCDPDGRFYCGSMGWTKSPGAGRLYRLNVDHSVERVLDGVTISNGLAWSPDGATAYYIDSPTRRVDAFDYDPVRGLTGRRPAVRLPDEDATPDGMTVDAEGYLWVAIWNGSAVRRYSPDGRLDGVVELPVSHVSACTFGGPELRDLYITTSREGIPEGTQPQAGAVFRARPGVTGLPVLPFAG